MFHPPALCPLGPPPLLHSPQCHEIRFLQSPLFHLIIRSVAISTTNNMHSTTQKPNPPMTVEP
jgi:hypothetical protein